MNNSRKYLFIFLYITSIESFGQEIDPSILSQLSPDQINKVKEIYSSENNSQASPSLEPLVVVEQSFADSEQIEDTNKKPGEKYGYNFFSDIPITHGIAADIPLPNDYKISLRDQLTIILSGSRDSIFDVNVQLDGTILFPELGYVSIAGKTFGEVKKILSELVNKSYIGVNINVSIKNLSAKKITIVGAVKKPGTYLVNPFSTITSALAYSGGISEIGTLRKIKLIRNTGEIIEFDLYQLLVFGDRSKDYTIEAGDTILIEAANQFVKLSGSVKRPAVYEILESDTLNNLINYGLGFADDASRTNIAIKFLKPPLIAEKTISDLNAELDNAISVEVFNLSTEQELNVFVDGAIEMPGFYSINEFKTLESLIAHLDFVDVYPWLAVLEQFDDNSLTKSIVLFNINDFDTYKDIYLTSNSRIYFGNLELKNWNPPRDTLNLIDEYSLNINHKRNRYKLPVIGKYDVDSFIKLLGLDMNDVEESAIYVSPTENIVRKENYKKMSFIAKKFNTITFRSKINDLIEVSIMGAVDYPGTYTLSPSSTLQDLYELAGDFKKDAFFDGIVIKKDSIKNQQIKTIREAKEKLNESIILSMQNSDVQIDASVLTLLSNSINIDEDDLGRISGDFKPNTQTAKKTILANGDYIFIPRLPYSVSVMGEVLNPTNFAFEKNVSSREAIALAGGLKEYADKRNIYVIRSNGLTEKAGRNIFLKDVKLNPGDTVVVPRKIIVTNPISETIAPITQVLSDLAFSAAALDNLTSNSKN